MSAQILGTIFVLLFRVLDFYSILIVAWCLLSWLPRTRNRIFEDLREAINMVVAPYIGLFRRILPSFGGLDFSPVLALLVIQCIPNLLTRILLWL